MRGEKFLPDESDVPGRSDTSGGSLATLPRPDIPPGGWATGCRNLLSEAGKNPSLAARKRGRAPKVARTGRCVVGSGAIVAKILRKADALPEDDWQVLRDPFRIYLDHALRLWAAGRGELSADR